MGEPESDDRLSCRVGAGEMRRVSRVLGAILTTAGLAILCLLSPNQAVAAYKGVPYWVAERVPARMSQLKLGMMEPQVLAALGLAGRVGPTMGNGSISQYHVVYPVQPGMSLCLTFDCRKKPTRFLWGDVTDTDPLRLRAVAVLGLVFFGGLLFKHSVSTVRGPAS